MSVNVPTRIANYGLTAAQVEPMWTDLAVSEGKKLRLSRHADNDVSNHFKQLTPKTVTDLQRFIGAPLPSTPLTAPRAAKSASVVSSALSAVPTGAELKSLWRSAYNAVFAGVANVSQVSALNKWLSIVNGKIYFWPFRDITVAANAQLILAPDVSILFANNILIEKGGQIICHGSIVKFDCASLTGFDGPAAGTGTGT